jgi:transposase InsO family protein
VPSDAGYRSQPGHHFLYLVTVMDWWSRAALSWRLSNTMDRGFAWTR